MTNNRFLDITTYFAALCLVLTVQGCSIDDTLEGTFGQDQRSDSLDIVFPTSLDRVTFFNQEAFPVTGTCQLNNEPIRVQATGAIADEAICVDGNFSASLDFKTAAIPDGQVTITAEYANLSSASSSREEVELIKLTLPFVFVDGDTAVENSDLIFSVSLDRTDVTDVVFDWSAVNGEAVSPADFPATSSQTVTISAGSSVASITLAATNDALYETAETLSVSLSNAQNSYLAVTVVGATITDNDPLPILQVYDAPAVTEGGTLQFIVSLDTVSGADAFFNFRSFDVTATSPADFTSVVGTGTISAGSLTTTLSLPVLPDGLYEATETLVVSLSNYGDVTTATPGTTDLATGTLLESNSPPSIYISDDTQLEGVDLVFNVTLSIPSQVDAVFDIQTYDGTATTADSDYTAINNQRFTLEGGASSTSITVSTGNDTDFESDEVFSISLAAVSGAAVASAGTDDLAVGTITNDELGPMLYVFDSAAVAEGGAAEFVVSLSAAHVIDVTFDWQTLDGTARDSVEGTGGADYTAVSLTSSTISAGDLALTLSVATLDDDYVEESETLYVSLSGASAGISIADDLAIGTINDVDSLPADPLWIAKQVGNDDLLVMADLSLPMFTEPGKYSSHSLQNDVGYCNERWVVATDGGTILTTTNLVTWTEVDLSLQLTGVGEIIVLECLEDRLFLAMDNPDLIAFSDDTLTWTESSTPSIQLRWAKTMVYHLGSVVVPGNNGTVLVSTDFGSSFVEKTIGSSSDDFYTVVGADGTLIMGGRVTNLIYISEDDFDSSVTVSLNPMGIVQYQDNGDYLDGRYFQFTESGSGAVGYGLYSDDLATATTLSASRQIDDSVFSDGLVIGFSGETLETFESSDRGASFSRIFASGYSLNTARGKIAYGHPSVDPDSFVFPDVTGAATSSLVESGQITISGISVPLGVYAGNGAEVSIVGGGGWFDGWGGATVSNGDSLLLRMSSPSSLSSQKVTTVRIGPKRSEWMLETTSSIDLFVADAAAVTEGGTAEFVVSLASALGSDVTFAWETVDGTATAADLDYAVSGATSLTIGTGTSQVTISVETTDDNQFESDETFSVSLSDVSANANLVDDIGMVTISNDEVLTLEFSSTGKSLNEDNTVANSQMVLGGLGLGNSHSCGIGANNRVYCWGSGNSGRLGDGGTGNHSSAVSIHLGAGPSQYKHVTAGGGSTCGLGIDDRVYCWGAGGSGGLGDGGTSNQLSAVSIALGEGSATYKFVDAGAFHSCGIGMDDRVYCWGRGIFGQLGDGNTTDQSSAVSVIAGAGPSTYKSVASGGNHTCGIGVDDQVYCWGSGTFGRLGDGDTGSHSSAVSIQLGEGPGTYKQLGAGSQHTCALGTDDRIYCWGNGTNGQLGDGSTGTQNSAVSILLGAGPGTYKQLGVGDDFNCAIGTDDLVYCWGSGNSGKLGDGNSGNHSSAVSVNIGAGPGDYKQVAAGANHSCAIGSDDQVYCWGNGGAGQLGDGDTGDHSSPVAVSDGENTGGLYLEPSVALPEFVLNLTSWFASDITVPFTVGGTATDAATDYDFEGFSSVLTIAARETSFTGSITINDDSLVEGDEEFTISLGSPSQGSVGTQATHTVTIIDNDSVAAIDLFVADAGSVTEGSAAEFIVSLASAAVSDVTFAWETVDGTATSADSDYSVFGATSLTIGAGSSQVTISVATTDDNQFEVDETFAVSLSDVSSNANVVNNFALGTINNDEVLTINFATSAKSFSEGQINLPASRDGFISAGVHHACALGPDAGIYCWGYGSGGRLGDGDTDNETSPVTIALGESPGSFTSVSSGGSHTCGVGTDSWVYCWGRGLEGQLGDGSTSSQSAAVSIHTGSSTGSFQRVASGSNHTCALTESGELYCWGRGSEGQLGDGDVGNHSSPVSINLGESSGSFKTVAASNNQTCAIGDDDVAYCWGLGNFGQLGDGDVGNHSSPVSVVAGHSPGTFKEVSTGTIRTCALGTDDRAYCWGDGGSGNLGDGDTGDHLTAVSVVNGMGPGTFKQISAGPLHACGLATDDRVYCWGSGLNGEIGDGDTGNHSSPVQVVNGESPGTFKLVSAGQNFACALGTDDKAYCWGSDGFGKLGTGTSSTGSFSSPLAVLNGENSIGIFQSPTPGLQLVLSAWFASDITVPFTVGGTATGSGTDYDFEGFSSVLTIASGETSFTGSITINDDSLVEGDEEFTVSLGAPSQGAVGSQATHTVTIVDNDSVAAIDLFVADAGSVTEGSAAEFIVSLASAAVSDVTFAWETVDGTATAADSDYSVFGATSLTIGTGSSLVTISVATTQDLQLESDENFFVSLSDVSASANVVDDIGIASIANDETLEIEFARNGQSVDEDISTSSEIVAFGGLDLKGFASCGISSENKIHCWGSGSSGQLGNGATGSSSIAVSIALGEGPSTYKQVSKGSSFTCGLGSDDRVYCWGFGGGGQLGNGATSDQSIPVSIHFGQGPATYKQVSAYEFHACGLGSDDWIYCWGDGINGLLGDGDTDDHNTPVSIAVGQGPAAYQQLSTGYFHNCALGTDDQLYCWGFGIGGALGDGDTGNHSSAVSIALGQGPGTYRQVSAGASYSCALGTDDRVYCWGANTNGKLGIGTGGNRSSAVPIALGQGPVTYKQISSGHDHTCGVGSDDKVYCWGSGANGRLGDGNTGYHSSAVAVSLGAGPGIYKQVSAGTYHSCGIGSDDKVYCWGRGTYGALGNGDTAEHTSPVAILDGENTGGLYNTNGVKPSLFLTLSAWFASDITVPFTVGGTATGSGTDYDFEGFSSVLTIAAGETSFTGSITINDDSLIEGDEELTVSLGSPSQGSLGSQATHTVTIVDNDFPIDLFVADAAAVTEGGTAEFVVSLASAAGSDVTFDWQTLDGTAKEAMAGHASGDYTPVATIEATIPAGDLAITLSVDSLDDDFVELAETFTVSLSNSSVNATISDAVGLGTINDVDTLPANPRWASVYPSDGQMYVTEDFSAYYFIEPGRFTAGTLSQEFGYCNGSWLIPTTSGTILHSSDLLNWSEVDVNAQVTDYDGTGVQAVSCLDNRWFIFNDSSSDTVVYSDNLTTWNQSNISGDLRFQKDFHYHEGKVFLSGNNGDQLVSTDFGANFTELNNVNAGLDSTSSAAADGFVFALQEPNDGVRYTEDDFVTVSQFTLVSGGASGSSVWSDYLDGRFVSVFRNNSNPYVAYTDDFTTMNTVSTPETLGAAEFGDGSLVALSFNGRSPYLSVDRGASFSALTVLPVSAWTIPARLTYGHPGVEPVSFSFADSTGVALGSSVESAEVTISGISLPLGVYVGNSAEVSIVGSGSWSDGWGGATVTNGDSFIMRMTSSSSPNTSKTATVRIGTRKVDWTTETSSVIDLFVADAAAVSEGANLEFVVSLASAAGSDVTFNWQTFDVSARSSVIFSTAADYVSVSSTGATISSGQSAVTLSVVTNDDSYLEEAETVMVSVSGISSQASGADVVGLGTINDTDVMPTYPLWVAAEDSNDDIMVIATLSSGPLYSEPGKYSSQALSGKIAYCNGKWSAATDGGTVLTTTDLISWTETDYSAQVSYSGTVIALECIGDRLFLVTDSTDGVAYSDDHTTWTASTGSSMSLRFAENIDAQHGTIIVPGQNGRVYVSTDNGVSFSEKVIGGGGNDFRSMAVADGRQIVSDEDIDETFISDDSFDTFTTVTLSTEFTTRDVVDSLYLNGRFMNLLSIDGVEARGYYSDDLVTPVSITSSPTPNVALKMVFSDGDIVGANIFHRVLSVSTDLGVTFNGVYDGGTPYGSGTFDIAYGHPGVEPVSFSFADSTGVALGSSVESAEVTISGISLPLGVYVGNSAEVSIVGSGSWSDGWGGATVTNGDSFIMRMTSSSSPNTSKTATVRIGTRKVDWTTETGTTVGVVVYDASTTEGGAAEFVVSLGSVAASDVTFAWQTVDGTATSADSDYSVFGATSLTIGAGSSQVTISVATTDDNQFETDETFAVSLSDVSSNASLVDDYAIGTITNDEVLTVNFSSTSQTVSEEGGSSGGSSWSGLIGLGANHSCAVGDGGLIYCWGEGSSGRTGGGDTVDHSDPNSISSGAGPVTYVGVDGGDSHSCALGTDSELYCWGGASNGRLGNEDDTTNQFTPVAVSLGEGPGTYQQFSVGFNTTCGLGLDSRIYCWGLGASGQIGDGDTGNHSSPVSIALGDGPETYAHVSNGEFHTCAVGSDSQVYCWGLGSNGRLGDGNTGDHNTAVSVVLGESPGTYKQVATATQHTCAIGTDDHIYCWGRGLNGRLGNGGTSDQSSPVSILMGQGPGTYQQIVMGETHGCALGTDERLYCWGQGSSGQLGDAANSDRTSAVSIALGDGPSTYRAVSAGLNHTCGIGTDDKAYCWGVGTSGKLGDGNTGSHNSPQAVLDGENTGGVYDLLVPQFQIYMSAWYALDVVVPFSVSGTATGFSTDYEIQGGYAEVTVAAGGQFASGSITIIDDALVEGPETFTISLDSPTQGVVGTQSTHTVSIVDNDSNPSGVDLFISDAIVSEGYVANFAAYLSSPADTVPVVFDYTVVSGTATVGLDSVSEAGRITIPVGELAAQIAVQTIEDSGVEASETFYVSLSGVSGASLVDDVGAGVIVDNDSSLPAFIVADNEGDEGTSLTVSFELSDNAPGNVTFNVNTNSGTATDGVDYTNVTNRLLTITAGSASTSFTITLSDSDGVEVTEYFTVEVSSLSGAEAAEIVGVMNINDTDSVSTAESIAIYDASAEEGDVAEFEISISSSLAQDLAVYYLSYTTGSADTDDFEPLDTTSPNYSIATIASGETSTTGFYQLIDDGLLETDETFVVSIVGMSEGLTLADATATITIVNSEFNCPSEGWCQSGFIKTPTRQTDLNLGINSLDVKGDTLVVSGVRESSDYTGIFNGLTMPTAGSLSESGAAYVFKKNSGAWEQESFIKSLEPDSNDDFAYSTRLSSDTMVVASRYEDSNVTGVSSGAVASTDDTATDSGAVFVYTRSGSTWTQQAFVKPTDSASSYLFGSSSDIDGDTMVVGAPGDSSSEVTISAGSVQGTQGGASGAGAAFVYTRSGSTWTQQAYLKASNAGSNDSFGSQVHIDRDLLVVSAPGEGSNSTTIDNSDGSASSDDSLASSGAVYVYKRSGGVWTQDAYLKPSNNEAGLISFGDVIAIDGDTLAVSTRYEDNDQATITNGSGSDTGGGLSDSGAVYIYRRDVTTGNWAQEAYIKPDYPAGSYGFGSSIALSGDQLAVGSVGESSSLNLVINGSRSSEDSSAAGSGSVHIFTRTGSTWSQSAFVKPFNSKAGSSFGAEVSLDGDTLAVSHPYEDSDVAIITEAQASSDTSSSDSGAVHLYERKGSAHVVIRTSRDQAASTSSLPIQWEVKFSKEISPATFSVADIDTAAGTTASGITWSLTNSGDNRTYTLEATAVTGDGVIIPKINADTVFDLDNFGNLESSPNFDASVTKTP